MDLDLRSIRSVRKKTRLNASMSSCHRIVAARATRSEGRRHRSFSFKGPVTSKEHKVGDEGHTEDPGCPASNTGRDRDQCAGDNCGSQQGPEDDTPTSNGADHERPFSDPNGRCLPDRIPGLRAPKVSSAGEAYRPTPTRPRARGFLRARRSGSAWPHRAARRAWGC